MNSVKTCLNWPSTSIPWNRLRSTAGNELFPHGSHQSSPIASAWGRAVFDHKTQIAQLDQLKAKAIMGTRPILTSCGSRRNQAYVWTEGRPEASPLHEKYYLPDEPGYWEATWYERGEKKFDVARALGARIGVQICTEMWFFEWARHYAKSRVDMLCIPRATPNGSTEKWLAGGQTAAVCSGAYCLAQTYMGAARSWVRRRFGRPGMGH